jgi:hypothetical protein
MITAFASPEAMLSNAASSGPVAPTMTGKAQADEAGRENPPQVAPASMRRLHELTLRQQILRLHADDACTRTINVRNK